MHDGAKIHVNRGLGIGFFRFFGHWPLARIHSRRLSKSEDQKCVIQTSPLPVHDPFVAAEVDGCSQGETAPFCKLNRLQNLWLCKYMYGSTIHLLTVGIYRGLPIIRRRNQHTAWLQNAEHLAEIRLKINSVLDHAKAG